LEQLSFEFTICVCGFYTAPAYLVSFYLLFVGRENLVELYGIQHQLCIAFKREHLFEYALETTHTLLEAINNDHFFRCKVR